MTEPLEPVEATPRAALDQLGDEALEALVADETQPQALRDDADAVLAERIAKGLGVTIAPTVLDVSDAAGARLALVQGIAAAMAEVEGVAKDGRNQQDNYAYATVEGMLKAVRAPLFKRGVLLFAHPGSHAEREVTSRSGNKGTLIDLVIDFRFTNGIADYEVHGWRGQGVDYSDKALSKAYTSALKTFVRAQWLLPAGEDDPDATTPESYGRNRPPAAQLPAWATEATDERRKKLRGDLLPLIGPERTAALAQATRDTFGTVPDVLVGFVNALAAHLRAELGPALDERAGAREAEAARRAQDAAAEAPHPPAPEPEPQAPPTGPAAMIHNRGDGQPCNARQQGTGLVCVLRAGHAHRGEEDHVTASGHAFPDDERVTWAAPDTAAPSLLDEPPVDVPEGAGEATDGPAPGTVPTPEQHQGESTESYLLRLRDAGCVCPDPTGDNKLDTCPLTDHGIPF